MPVCHLLCVHVVYDHNFPPFDQSGGQWREVDYTLRHRSDVDNAGDDVENKSNIMTFNECLIIRLRRSSYRTYNINKYRYILERSCWRYHRRSVLCIKDSNKLKIPRYYSKHNSPRLCSEILHRIETIGKKHLFPLEKKVLTWIDGLNYIQILYFSRFWFN